MALTAGTRLGPYEILSLIGKGGMGEVYRARDTRLRRAVAVKVLLPSFAVQHDRLRRFEQEARAVGRLTHPNILVIYDIGTHEGSPYLVTELLEGETLHHKLLSGALPIRKAVDYAIQVSQGLAAAHANGILHRDLKPENIFLTKDGRVKILDFGLAKLTQGEAMLSAEDETLSATMTDSGTILGTAGYMAPEQVRGEAIDERADVFSFGAVLFEMLAGTRAFNGETMVERLNAILNTEVPALTEVRKDVPPALERIVRLCLEKNPAERFQSAWDAACYLDALSTSGTAPGPKLRRFLPRKIVALAGLALLTAWTLGVFIAGHRSGHTISPAFQRLTFRRGPISAARFAPDGQTILYSAAWEGDSLRLFSTRLQGPESSQLPLPPANLMGISKSGMLAIGVRPRIIPPLVGYIATLAQVPLAGGAPRELLDGVTQADWSPDGSQLVLVHGGRLQFPTGNVVYETVGWLSHVRVSPDGKRVAFLDHPTGSQEDRGSVMVAEARGKAKTISPGWQSVEGLAWSPYGDEIWFSGARSGFARDLWAVSLEGRLRLVMRMAGGMTLHDISADGRVLLTRDYHREGIIGLLSGSAREQDLSWLDWSNSSDLSADGRTLLFAELGEGAGNRYAACIRGTDGSPVVQLGDGLPTALSPDGKWAVAIRNNPTPQLVLLPTRAGEPRFLERGPITAFTWASWFPDGKQIVLMGTEPGHGWRSYVQAIDGGPPRPITPEGTASNWLSWDGAYVIVSGDSLEYPVDGGPPRAFRALAAEDLPLRFSPDGQAIYVWRFGELPCRIIRIDLPSGRRKLWRSLMPSDPSGITGIGPVQISADGQSCVYTYGRYLSDLYCVEGLK